MNKFDLFENTINILGIAVSVTDLNNYINLLLLIVSALSLIIRSVIKIVGYLKNKDYNSASEEASKLNEDINKITQKEEKDNE